MVCEEENPASLGLEEEALASLDLEDEVLASLVYYVEVQACMEVCEHEVSYTIVLFSLSYVYLNKM